MESGSKEEQKKKQDFKWSRKLAIVEGIWSDKFPDKDGYPDSLWAMWESRIRKGHENEEALISKAAKRWESRLTEEQRELMPDDMFTDDFERTSNLTNNMYAALIVTLWSCVEGYFKDLLGVCKRKRRSRKTVRYRPHNISLIKEGFEKEINVKLDKQQNYEVLNAVRVLCNSFKHSEGFYLPKDEKPDTYIDSALLTKWKCISNRFVELDEIDYTQLPIQELVITCGAFCQRLLSETERKLKRRACGC